MQVDAARWQWVLSVLQQYEARLLRYALRVTGDADLARDVVQHAFTKLCSQAPQDVQQPGPWLYAVCRNRAVDIKRRESRMQPLNEDAAGALYAGMEPPPAEVAEAHDSCDLVRRLITTLPAAQQEVVDLWAEGLSYREIAGVTDRKEGSIRVMVHRAFKTLREHPLAKQMLETTQEPSATPLPSPLAGDG